MHVSLHQDFKDYLGRLDEPGLYERVLAESGLTAEQFEAEPYHDDEEMHRAVEAAAQLLSRPRMDFLTGWGISTAPGLLTAFDSAIEPDWKLFDLLENIEGRVHTFTRSEYGARPPILETERVSERELRIDVSTVRQMTGLAKGFVLGFADHYGESVDVEVDERDTGFTFTITTP